MAEVDTSFYKDAVAENPLDAAGKVVEYKNKLLGNIQHQQAVEKNAIGIDSDKVNLAMKRFGIMNDVISSYIGDEEFGKKDLKPKINSGMGRLVKEGVLSPQHAVEALQGISDDPRIQANQLRNFHTLIQSAVERGNSFFGQPQTQNVGNALVTTQTPQYPGKPVTTRSQIPLALPPTTEQVNPDLSRSPIGGTGIPQVQQGSPSPAPSAQPIATPAAPVAAPRGAAPPAAPSGRIITQAPPGQAAAAERTGVASGEMLAAERSRAANYRREVYPLEQAIPALERLGKTGTGPGTEQVNQIKSFLQSAGVPGLDVKKIKDYDEAHKYLTDWVTANGDSSTNDKLAAAFSSNASTKISNAAAVDVAKAALSLRKMKQAQLEEFQATGMPDDKFAKWASEWNRKQDPRVYGWDYMNDTQRKNMLSSVTGPKRDLMIMQLHQAAENGLIDPNSLTPSKK